MKLSAVLFALFSFPTFVTPILLLDSANDGRVNVKVTAKRLDEHNVDKRELSNDMFGIVNAINVYADEYNHHRGYSRADFTQNIVQALYNRNPHFNYIICHPDHDYNFGTSWGVNVYNVWVLYDDGNIFNNGHGYDVVVGKNGTFTNWGDGGYKNWAYIGYAESREQVSNPNDEEDFGTMVTFGLPA